MTNTPIAAARNSFYSLVEYYGPTALDIPTPEGTRIMDLNWLAQQITHLDQNLSDQVWQAVIKRVRTKESDWVTVGVGLAAKPLRSVVNRVGSHRIHIHGASGPVALLSTDPTPGAARYCADLSSLVGRRLHPASEAAPTASPTLF